MNATIADPEADSRVEPAPEEIADCPVCGAPISLAAKVCPACGESFPDPVRLEPGDAYADPANDASPGSRRKAPAGIREKLLVYGGIALILLGGPGIALFSWLHDVLHITVLNYDAFSVFGPVNRLVVALGLIVTIVGIVLFILGIRLARPTAEEVEIRESSQV